MGKKLANWAYNNFYKSNLKNKFKHIFCNFIMENKFYCKKCNYSTNKKSHWDKHLNTQKHKNVFKCTICEMVLGSKSSYYRHVKNCKNTIIIKKLCSIENKLVELEKRIKSCEDKL